ncbi:hypothetical protein [Desulfurococcus amylolyticus]|uniref:Uncharacterized protein n=1 Tax=Desulfurococcus amylolyticus DSM 16532 TaxID=768672 RepID=I3XPW6_DESAM|nr:hypothetical protein [Desulfurococcus amylolyticus]AFL65990.1 hypothetical protein Desfe_0077 [Desulfurococcus amylolyticus DSM 16532]
MSRKKIMGLIITFSTLALSVIYTYLLFFSTHHVQALTLKLTVYFFVIVLLASLFIVGYTLLRTNVFPPEEVEEAVSSEKA